MRKFISVLLIGFLNIGPCATSYGQPKFLLEESTLGDVRDEIRSILENSIPYIQEKNEAIFHGLISTWYLQLPNKYKTHTVASEVDAGRGRLDSIFRPLANNEKGTVFIHEYKYAANEQECEDKFQEALWQIYAQNYMEFVAANNNVRSITARPIVICTVSDEPKVRMWQITHPIETAKEIVRFFNEHPSIISLGKGKTTEQRNSFLKNVSYENFEKWLEAINDSQQQQNLLKEYKLSYSENVKNYFIKVKAEKSNILQEKKSAKKKFAQEIKERTLKEINFLRKEKEDRPADLLSLESPERFSNEPLFKNSQEPEESEEEKEEYQDKVYREYRNELQVEMISPIHEENLHNHSPEFLVYQDSGKKYQNQERHTQLKNISEYDWYDNNRDFRLLTKEKIKGDIEKGSQLKKDKDLQEAVKYYEWVTTQYHSSLRSMNNAGKNRENFVVRITPIFNSVIELSKRDNHIDAAIQFFKKLFYNAGEELWRNRHLDPRRSSCDQYDLAPELIKINTALQEKIRELVDKESYGEFSYLLGAQYKRYADKNKAPLHSRLENYTKAKEHFEQAAKLKYVDNSDDEEKSTKTLIRKCSYSIKWCQDEMDGKHQGEKKGKGGGLSATNLLASPAHEVFSTYYGYGINEIIGLRLKQANIFSKEIIQTLPIYIDRHQNNVNHFIKAISQLEKSQKALSPINLYDLHWAGLVIEKREDGYLLVYMDPENQPIPAVLEAKLYQHFAERAPSSQIAIWQRQVEPQKYGNCGPEVVENFVEYLTGQRVSQEAAVLLHSRLMEDHLLDRQTPSSVLAMEFPPKPSHHEEELTVLTPEGAVFVPQNEEEIKMRDQLVYAHNNGVVFDSAKIGQAQGYKVQRLVGNNTQHDTVVRSSQRMGEPFMDEKLEAQSCYYEQTGHISGHTLREAMRFPLLALNDNTHERRRASSLPFIGRIFHGSF